MSLPKNMYSLTKIQLANLHLVVPFAKCLLKVSKLNIKYVSSLNNEWDSHQHGLNPSMSRKLSFASLKWGGVGSGEKLGGKKKSMNSLKEIAFVFRVYNDEAS